MHKRELARSGKTSEKYSPRFPSFRPRPYWFIICILMQSLVNDHVNIALEIPGVHEILWSVQIKTKECFKGC